MGCGHRLSILRPMSDAVLSLPSEPPWVAPPQPEEAAAVADRVRRGPGPMLRSMVLIAMIAVLLSAVSSDWLYSIRMVRASSALTPARERTTNNSPSA